jgi:hypothetical protein
MDLSELETLRPQFESLARQRALAQAKFIDDDNLPQIHFEGLERPLLLVSRAGKIACRHPDLAVQVSARAMKLSSPAEQWLCLLLDGYRDEIYWQGENFPAWKVKPEKQGPRKTGRLVYVLADSRKLIDRLLLLAESAQTKPNDDATVQAPKGKPGRRGYPIAAWQYARKLRAKNPQMKAHSLRAECLKRFSEDDLPPDGDSFRRWLNRKRANRAN